MSNIISKETPESKLEIIFTHIATQRTVSFIAFLESFSDTFTADWSSEKVFGRLDPVAQYKGTDRKISCAFTIPSDSLDDCAKNHVKISSLLNMMYPTYEQFQGSQIYTISSTPLMLVKFNNLIKSASSPLGLLGYIPSLKYEPDMNSPIFTIPKNYFSKIGKVEYKNIADTNLASAPNEPTIAFQSLKMSFDLNVLHTHMNGYKRTKEGTTNTKKFPNGHDILRPGWR